MWSDVTEPGVETNITHVRKDHINNHFVEIVHRTLYNIKKKPCVRLV